MLAVVLIHARCFYYWSQLPRTRMGKNGSETHLSAATVTSVLRSLPSFKDSQALLYTLKRLLVSSVLICIGLASRSFHGKKDSKS